MFAIVLICKAVFRLWIISIFSLLRNLWKCLWAFSVMYNTFPGFIGSTQWQLMTHVKEQKPAAIPHTRGVKMGINTHQDMPLIYFHQCNQVQSAIMSHSRPAWAHPDFRTLSTSFVCIAHLVCTMAIKWVKCYSVQMVCKALKDLVTHNSCQEHKSRQVRAVKL